MATDTIIFEDGLPAALLAEARPSALQGITGRFEFVTPEKAERWLREANAWNRPLNENLVLKLARDIESGNWRTTHQGIAFDRNGNLTDGQHRLHAIGVAGRGVWVYVSHGWDPDTREAIDQGRNRTLRDVLALTGTHVGNREVAVAKRMMRGMVPQGSFKVTRAMELAFFREHAEAVHFAVATIPSEKRALTQAAVKAVIARAFYAEDHDELRRFTQVLLSGEGQEPRDRTVLRLRDFLLIGKRGRKADTGEVYAKVERALKAFVDRESLAIIYAVNQEQWPLPAERR